MKHVFPSQIARVKGDQALIILTFQCSTENDLVDSQVDYAREKATEALQMAGVSVSATSTALRYQTQGGGIVKLTAEVTDAEVTDSKE